MGRSALRARLLGAMELRIGNDSLPGLDSARAESLLAYLLLHREAPQPRHRLAFLLWPDSTEAQALTNLRKVLHTLRRTLPDADEWIEVAPRTLQWREDAPLWFDVEEFERAIEEGCLDEAIALYGGELLEGCYDEWLTEERERLASLYLDALDRLARSREQEGRWPEAIRHAERLVAADPLREESHRLLIGLCHAAGDRARAVRAYHVCAATLERELGIEPSPGTRATYEAVLDAGLVEAGGAAVSPLVGRDAELAQLRDEWREAIAGRARLVLVSGEPGIGKTRLVDELRMQVDGGVVDARGYSVGAPIAYAMVTAWLRSQPVVARLPRLGPAELTELSRLLPELAERVPPPEPLPEAELRRRLFGAVARALLAAGTPMLLVADDVQWADPQSLRLVHYLLHAMPSARLLVAATARREELDPRHPLAELIAALQALGRFTEIELYRLGRADTGMLATAVGGTPLAAAELERLYRDSEGNPLFIVEALRSDAPETAARVQAVIAGRLRRLSEPAAELASTAAAIGRSFGAGALPAASGLDEPTFVRSLDELWRRGIVRAHGPAAYDFSHERVREAAYAALSPPRRRHAHLAIARALEATAGSAPATVALHYERAGATVEAIRWHERAAEAAQWLHAHIDAVQGARACVGTVRRACAEPRHLGVAAKAADSAPGAAGGLRGLRLRAHETAPPPSRAPGVAAWHRASAAARVVACAGCPHSGRLGRGASVRRADACSRRSRRRPDLEGRE
jgi:DNA-binding SARP family transcriptional activator